MNQRSERAYLSEPSRKCRKNTVTPSVTASVTGAAIHTPVMPKRYGSVKIQVNNTISPLSAEITADSNALPVAVK